MILPVDDLLHSRDDNPYWNESAWFGFAMPELNRHAFIHFYHRPNLGYTVTNIGFWDSTGSEQRDCLYYHFDITPMEKDSEMYDFESESGLKVECLEKLKKYRLRYKHRRCEFDLQFEAIMAPHDTGLPEGIEDYGRHHYEQAGRLIGTVTIDGAELPVNTWCDRDHSWGPRRLIDNPRGAFHWAIASDRSAFHINAVSRLPLATDPILGTTEEIVSGFLLRDGVVGTIRSGKLQTIRANDATPLSIHLKAVDSLGRELLAVGRPTNELKMYFHSFPLFQWWCTTKWDIDGEEAWGEIQDYFPTWQIRSFLRAQQLGNNTGEA